VYTTSAASGVSSRSSGIELAGDSRRTRCAGRLVLFFIGLPQGLPPGLSTAGEPAIGLRLGDWEAMARGRHGAKYFRLMFNEENVVNEGFYWPK